MTDRLAVTVFVAESRIPHRIRDSLISICRAGASLNTMMLARRLASRARSVRLFSSPSHHKGRILQTVGRVTLVSIIAGLFFSCRVSHSLIFLQRPARSTTSRTRNATLAHSCHSTQKKRRLLSSEVAGAQRAYSNISTLRITTLSASPLSSDLLSHILPRLSSVQRTFSSLPPSSPPSQSAPSARVPSYSVCPRTISLSLSSPVATRFLTRHKARQVSVIEAEATDVDVRPCFPLMLHFLHLSSPSTRPSPSQVVYPCFFLHFFLMQSQTRLLFAPSSQPAPYTMTTSSTPSGPKHRPSVFPV